MSVAAVNTVPWAIIRHTDVFRQFLLENNSTGRPINLSSCSARIRFRSTKTPSAVAFTRSTDAGTITNGTTTGIFTIKFDNTEDIAAGEYYGDFVYVDADGNEMTLMRINLIVEPSYDNP